MQKLPKVVAASLLFAYTVAYWIIAAVLSLICLFAFFGDYGAGHSDDVQYMHEISREIALGRWLALGICLAGYVLMLIILRRRLFDKGG